MIILVFQYLKNIIKDFFLNTPFPRIAIWKSTLRIGFNVIESFKERQEEKSFWSKLK